jgi:hypothetical protein
VDKIYTYQEEVIAERILEAVREGNGVQNFKLNSFKGKGVTASQLRLRNGEAPWRGETFGFSPMESGAKRAHAKILR